MQQQKPKASALESEWTEKEHDVLGRKTWEHMWYSDDYPLLLRISEVDNFDEQYYRLSFQSTGDHEKHPHVTLFESPILDSVDDARMMAEAIAAAPMRYARHHFKQGKVKR